MLLPACCQEILKSFQDLQLDLKSQTITSVKISENSQLILNEANLYRSEKHLQKAKFVEKEREHLHNLDSNKNTKSSHAKTLAISDYEKEVDGEFFKNVA